MLFRSTARDAAVARLRTLEAKSSAAARALSDIDADLIAAAEDSTAREEAAYSAEEQLMILADESQTASTALSADQAALDDLLAALMTFGSRRPPALAASPEDSAAAVRALILLQALLNKISDPSFTERQRTLLQALFLTTADQMNQLWAYPLGRNRPHQLIRPPAYQETNLWHALLRSLNLWQD